MPLKESRSRRRRKEYDDRDIYRSRDRNRSPKPQRRRRRSSPTLYYAIPNPYNVTRNVSDPQQSSFMTSYTPTSRERRTSTSPPPEMDRRASSGATPERKASFPYPNFSKAHSREAVGSREQLPSSRVSFYTPEPTDLGQNRSDDSRSPKAPPPMRTRSAGHAPPSPPLSNEEPDLRRAKTGTGIRQTAATGTNSRSRGRKSFDGPRFSASQSDLREAEEGRRTPSGSFKNPDTDETPKKKMPKDDSSKFVSPSRKIRTHNISDVKSAAVLAKSPTNSDATSIAPDRKAAQKQSIDLGPPTGGSSSIPPITTSTNDYFQKSPNARAINLTPPIPLVEVFTSESELDPTAAPPPPPPPALSSPGIPKVDYLLQNGGLPQPISKSFPSSLNPPPQPYVQWKSPDPSAPAQTSKASLIFSSYQKHLDDVEKIISQNGSIAVATGYKSVARRLLDRLESVFARNISSETCTCIICQTRREQLNIAELDTGVSWGEVLELVSGRSELPPWPPFTLPVSGSGLGLSGIERQPPMQNIDIDVPEEFREHYLRQSKKAKQAVHEWLLNQPVEGPSPPAEADDETLAFAMLTYLEPDQRRTFTALLRGLSSIPESRAPTPASTTSKTDFLSKTSTSLQRLYRLSKRPREPECCMFLLKNPTLHNSLATLSAINNTEWDILISGRFDGFLWSGAEDPTPSTPTLVPSQLPSRSASVTPISRNQTPFNGVDGGGVTLPKSYQSSGNATPITSNTQINSTIPRSPTKWPGPVAMDEETEIAVLAEVEREIFQGMEALEDAFESLHMKAESVRRALRERGAGLTAGARARTANLNGLERVEARMDTPAIPTWQSKMWNGSNTDGSNSPYRKGSFEAIKSPPGINSSFLPTSGSDDGFFDERSELAPDDSASNIGHKESRHRHRFRRRTKTRRTPAPVDEGDENDV